ncbi:MAG: hypothetical protein QXT13_10190 [Pyrobaculum sp.]
MNVTAIAAAALSAIFLAGLVAVAFMQYIAPAYSLVRQEAQAKGQHALVGATDAVYTVFTNPTLVGVLMLLSLLLLILKIRSRYA